MKKVIEQIFEWIAIGLLCIIGVAFLVVFVAIVLACLPLAFLADVIGGVDK